LQHIGAFVEASSGKIKQTPGTACKVERVRRRYMAEPSGQNAVFLMMQELAVSVAKAGLIVTWSELVVVAEDVFHLIAKKRFFHFGQNGLRLFVGNKQVFNRPVAVVGMALFLVKCEMILLG